MAIFYYIIKAAVKFGTIEAFEELNKAKTSPSSYSPKIEDNKPNAAQWELQQKYEKGKISFEEYQIEWEKLK